NLVDGTVEAKLDVVVGRILADEVPLANTLVDKIIAYSDKASYGNWRNSFVLISDDVDEVYEYRSLEVTLDSIGDRVTAEKPYINVKKIHSDAFRQETSAGGNRYPEVNEAIINSIEVGTLIVNYFGHGGEDGLAKEFIFTKTDGQNLQNRNRFPCIVTVTCEFTKFDNPLRETGGELTYWNRDGGAISLITTTRSIGVQLGVSFNLLLAEELFGFGLNVPATPAEALAETKNQISDDGRRVIFYVGDPAMPLAFPRQSARITTLNDVPIGQATDTLKALSRVKFGGEVVDAAGNVLNNYNGVLEAKVFDKDLQRQTLANDGVRDSDGNLLIMEFKTLGEVIFNGQATIRNGTFEFEFVVPKDIQIPVGNGKVSLYAEKDAALEDQTGYNLDILVGGLNENAPEDNTGPTIQLFMNDESFVSGGITNDSPFLIAKLEDENGINTASGIGHDLIAILDGDEANPIVLNEYYQADVDDFTKGMANYKLRNLEEGLHTLTLKAWDVYNNSATGEIQFVVFGDDKLEIQRVLNYPNPFVDYTEFWFEHNRPTEPLEIQVQVFTVTGKVVRTMNRTIMTDGGQSRDIVWDGRDDFGERIGKGVYVYKLTVKSTLTNQQVEKFEKLVIL
ncbi:MAG: type IX secretion system sortase PorU, partial [Flavobacteriaceae bacterium]|nr:type IX secretion system sortase PorU [Flavobacteriaceae bacterium]